MSSTARPILQSAAPAVPNVVLSYPATHILLATLNRPDSLNAIPSMHHALFQSLWEWYDSEPWLRCAIVTGKGRAFCAGADLKEWNSRFEAAHSEEQPRGNPGQSDAPSIYSAGFGGLSNRAGKKPVIAAVNGLCLGGGMEMAINCDMVIASADASFGLPEVRIGVIALAGALPRLVRAVGKQRAAEMAMLGRSYDPFTMRDWGIVNAVVPRGENVVDEAVRWAQELANNSPDSIIVSREGLRLGSEGIGPVAATEELGKGLFKEIEAGENMQEGVRSFVERRKPVWTNSKL
jgi:enoyl-CoA hydratase/carnithine racemase